MNTLLRKLMTMAAKLAFLLFGFLPLMMVVMLFFGGGDAWGPVCVMADDFGDTQKESTAVAGSTDDWTDSGVTVDANQSLDIVTYGTINLCPEGAGTAKPSAKNGGWQSTGIYVSTDKLIEITASDKYSPWGGNDCSSDTHTNYALYVDGTRVANSGRWNDKGATNSCYSSEGKGLFVYIGDSPPTSLPGTSTAADITSRTYEGSGDDLFELYDYTKRVAGFTQDYAPVSGQVYLRYDMHGTNSNSDNRGGYSVLIGTNCIGTLGQYLQFSIGSSGSAGSTTSLHNSGGHYSTSNAPASGKLWFRVTDNAATDWNGDGMADGAGDGVYTTNTGKYTVEITIPGTSGTAERVFSGIINPVKKFVTGENYNGETLPERFFKGIVYNNEFVEIVLLALQLSVVLYAAAFLVGISGQTYSEFIVYMFRFALVLALISPNSWDFFYNNLFRIFLDGIDDLSSLLTSQFMLLVDGSDTSTDLSGDMFHFLGQTLDQFFSDATNIKISAIVFSNPLGFAYAILIYVGMFFFIFLIAKALILYLLALIMITVLVSVSPIFIIFMLFSMTRTLFDRWIKALISFSLQPILLFMVLSIFNIFVYSALHYLLSFNACWRCMVHIDLPLSEATDWLDAGNWDKFCMFYSYQPWGIDTGDSPAISIGKTPANLFSVAIFLLFINAMYKMTEWILEVTNSLTGSTLGSLTAATNNVVGGAATLASAGATVAQPAIRYGLKGTQFAIRKPLQGMAALGSSIKEAVKKTTVTTTTQDGRSSLSVDTGLMQGLRDFSRRMGFGPVNDAATPDTNTPGSSNLGGFNTPPTSAGGSGGSGGGGNVSGGGN